MNMYDLPIYEKYYKTFLEIFKELEILRQSDCSHKILVNNAYNHAINIFPYLNAGYNYWSLKDKLKIYNKVRALLSELLVELSILDNLKLIKQNYDEIINSSIKYMNSLIRKLEMPNLENGKKKQ